MNENINGNIKEDIPETIQEKLKRFQEFWNESLNENYTNQAKLADLARQIRDLKCDDDFLVSTLTATEQITYHYAKLLANYKG